MIIKQVEMYATPTCGYCKKAKSLLEQMGVDDIKLITLGVNGVTKQTLQEHMDNAVPTHGKVKTVPQIFINDEHIGGYTELLQLVNDGKITVPCSKKIIDIKYN